MVKSVMETAPAKLIDRFLALASIPSLLGIGCATHHNNVEEKQSLFSEASYQGAIDEAMRSRIIRYRFVAVNLDLITGQKRSNQYSSTLQLNLFDDAIFTAILDRRDGRSETSIVWFGHIEGIEDSQVTLAVESGIIAGNVRIQQTFYQVRYVGEGTHVLYQINPAVFPPDSKPLAVPNDWH